MIFLGAGASKVFGLKTLQDMTNLLVENMRVRGHGETVDKILGALREFGLTPDFENIYTTLEALQDPKEGIRKSGAFTAYVASQVGFGNIKEHPEYGALLADFRNLIYDECSIQRGEIERKRSIFDRLFQVVLGRDETRVLTSKTGVIETRAVNIGNTIVTTNYDVAVELYHRLIDTEIGDGFKATRKEYTKELDFQEYGRLPTSRWLIKLHGSIWQFRQGDRVIQTIADPQSLPLEVSVGEQMMIYPVGEKPILQEPYYSFYSIFKEQPWNVLIVIGYSFRDEPVNIAILEKLKFKSSPRPKLIVVDPNAKSVIKGLGPEVSKLDQRIIRIEEPFTDIPNLFGKLKIALESRSWNEYKTRVDPLGSVRQRFPSVLQQLLSFQQKDEYVIIKPSVFLDDNNFQRALSIVKELGGEYIPTEDPQKRYFRVPTSKNPRLA